MKMSMVTSSTITIFLFISSLSSSLSLSSSAPPHQHVRFPASLAFAVLGDFGAAITDQNAREQQQQVGLFLESYAAARRSESEEEGDHDNDDILAVFAPGDLMYPSGLTGNVVADAARIKTSFSDVYSNASDGGLNIPFYCALGNHDYSGNLTSVLSNSGALSGVRGDPRWVLPSRYYAVSFHSHQDQNDFTMGNVDADFFIIDTTPSGIYSAVTDPIFASNIASANFNQQLTWIEQQLQASTAEWCFVIGHHTIYAGSLSSSFQLLQTLISPLLDKYGCNYISGHEHTLEHNQVNQTFYLVSGAGSQAPLSPKAPPSVLPSYNRFYGAQAGYLILNLNSSVGSAQFFGSSNHLLYSTPIPLHPNRPQPAPTPKPTPASDTDAFSSSFSGIAIIFTILLLATAVVVGSVIYSFYKKWKKRGENNYRTLQTLDQVAMSSSSDTMLENDI